MTNGTYNCPICGKDAPHHHTGAEVGEHRAEQKLYYRQQKVAADKLAEDQKQRRTVLQERMKQEAESELARLQKYIDSQNECSFCGWIPKGAQNLKYDCKWQYGFNIDEGNEAHCPECGKCVAAWE